MKSDSPFQSGTREAAQEGTVGGGAGERRGGSGGR